MNKQIKELIESNFGYAIEVLPDVAWVWFSCPTYAKAFADAVRDIDIHAERCGCSVKIES